MSPGGPRSTVIEIGDEEYTITRQEVVEAFERTESPAEHISHKVVIDDERKGSKDVFRNIDGTPDQFYTRHADAAFEQLGFEVIDESDKGDSSQIGDSPDSWRDLIRREIARYCTEQTLIEFSLQGLQEFARPAIQEHFPENETWQASMRRTLQELRNTGEITFLGNGRYRVNVEFRGELPTPTLYLFPGANEASKSHFDSAVREGIPRETYERFTDRELGATARVWGGFPDSQADTWDDVEPGDYLFFYRGDGRYGDVARVVATERNRDFAEWLWPDYVGEPAPDEDRQGEYVHLVYVTDVREIALPREILHDLADFEYDYPHVPTPIDASVLARIREQYGSLEDFIERYAAEARVWIEKTRQEGRAYKQEGELALGKALISPSRDEAGRKRYETMREADIGDVVLHLLQERDQIVGVSRIASELDEESAGPPNNRWSEEQMSAGGYKRELEGYVELDDPVDIYEDVLSNDEYSEDLHQIREAHDGKIIYNKRLALNQGHYFTEAPDDFVAILAAESADLPERLRSFGVAVPERGASLPAPVESYESISEAIDDIRERLDRGPVSNWLAGEVTQLVVEDWSEVLTSFGPESTVSLTEEGRLQQIRQLYAENSTRLREDAEQLGSGALGNLTKSETLFVALLRDLQAETGLTTNANHVKIELILNEKYDVGPSEVEDDPPEEEPPDDEPPEEEPLSHPLLTHLETLSPSAPVRKFTAPPDNWLTSIQYGAFAFRPEDQNIWEELEAGELVVFHTPAQPSLSGLSEQPSGVFGAGILGAKTTKDELWWGDETEASPYPYLVTFDRMFLTSDLEQLDVSTPVAEQSDTKLEQQLNALTADLLPFEEIQDICTDTNGSQFPAQGTHAIFRDASGAPDHDRPRALLEALVDCVQETATVHAHCEFDGTLSTDPLDGLYFPGDEKEDIIEQIEAALRTGKHIILTGPPGTGKTEIARRVCMYLVAEYPYLYSDFQLTTATADWSTFDTVGGYMPEASAETGDELSFTPGVVLTRLKDSQTDRQVNEPLIIDELNRADIDKAFGQLFTLLSGQSVQLPYTRDGAEIELLTASEIDRAPARHQYVVPESWRIFATMNTYDKTSLYEMSYAFMRRFAFIRIGAPSLPEEDSDLESLMRAYAAADVWDIDAGRQELRDVGQVWRAMNQAVEDRAIGPAIVEDLLAYVSHPSAAAREERLTRAIISYIFPQLEGVPKREFILKQIAAVDTVDEMLLNEAATEMLQVPIRSDE